ncbi:uncharacterized protein EV420DRAFT_1087137 [Desarmillaria tabescens]|uniref:Uncharacterized protein n=1 Tax=Armillaria tabescens TaxID=1929756 RepID=A0AA39JG12_ARMTA|nr:uncharacterized protein EV420DRAFT_1087137 [Desarmillaria tabescens]KAK0441734.1 hypothetical protein EV420DRAFT_1087137 [Desarmillaria tabescens]
MAMSQSASFLHKISISFTTRVPDVSYHMNTTASHIVGCSSQRPNTRIISSVVPLHLQGYRPLTLPTSLNGGITTMGSDYYKRVLMEDIKGRRQDAIEPEYMLSSPNYFHACRSDPACLLFVLIFINPMTAVVPVYYYHQFDYCTSSQHHSDTNLSA